MGDSQKPGGQLKDFRVHRGRVIDEGAAETGPKQQVSPRQSSVTEWSSRGMDTNLEKMWQEWSEDLGVSADTSLDLSSPVTSSNRSDFGNRPIAAPSAPRPPEMSSFEGRARGPLTPSPVAKPSTTPRAATGAGAPIPQALPTESSSSVEILVNDDESFSVSLALEERRMEREGVVDFSNTYRKQELLKLNTIEYAKLLQSRFRREIELFNDARRSASSLIQLYKVSKTEADFMLFRNGVKLIVSATQSGRIHFSFNQYMGQVHAPTHAPQMEIEAQWGSLDQLIWTYRGEKIDAKDLVRYFLTEFVKQSYR